jgi:hypothetical protein
MVAVLRAEVNECQCLKSFILVVVFGGLKLFTAFTFLKSIVSGQQIMQANVPEILVSADESVWLGNGSFPHNCVLQLQLTLKHSTITHLYPWAVRY